MKKYINYLLGGLCGILNGLFGSGGGTVAVACFEKSENDQRKVHASSVALILILSITTAVSYYIQGKLDFGKAFEFIPYGIIGALAGSLLLKKISGKVLKKIFGVIIIASAVKLLI